MAPGTLSYKVYAAARDGRFGRLLRLLRRCSQATIDAAAAALAAITDDETGQRMTPLIVAAQNGHVCVVQLLLVCHGVDVARPKTA